MGDVRFFKMTGSGNDFIMLDGREHEPAAWTPKRIQAACDRRTGIGADGLVILAPEGAGAVRMHFYNSDGGRAAMCGNAALCSTRISVRLGFAPASGMTLLADAGAMPTRCTGDADTAEIGFARLEVPRQMPSIPLVRGERWIGLGTVGVPHLVVLVDDIDAVDLLNRGPELRYHSAVGPEGANANFVALAGAGVPWLIRTYERGVEGETLACGTGTVAAALALVALGRGSLPLDFLSRGGFPLAVLGTLAGPEARDVWLRGQGRLVFEGCWNEGG
jgi:diaminopimelate epimerase